MANLLVNGAPGGCHLANIARELGRKLHWDPEAASFIGDDEANQLLDRPKRAGFELPEPV